MAQVGHVPGAGTAAAAESERARKEMLRDARIDARNGARPRIGADALCEALLRQGSDVIWGYPGGVILPLYDVLADHPQLRHILVRHEQGAAHAADGYARASGRVGVCLGTSGPGATNLVTGIGTAMLDSVPMVVIPAGSFMMGSPSTELGRQSREGPQHQVTLAQPIAVGKFHVTREEFAAFVNDTGYSTGDKCVTWTGQTWEEQSGKYWL